MQEHLYLIWNRGVRTEHPSKGGGECRTGDGKPGSGREGEEQDCSDRCGNYRGLHHHAGDRSVGINVGAKDPIVACSDAGTEL